MHPPRARSLVHLGDTSFRRKDVIAGYHDMLEVLADFRRDDRPWDAVTQLEFYGLLRALAPDVFGSGGSIADDDAAKRARTYTNALAKLGFVDEQDRRITALGTMFTDGRPQLLDEVDRLCALKPENSAVLRGALSYVERTDDGGFYYPVRLLLQVLNRLEYLRIDEFALAFIAAPRLLGVEADAIVAAIETMRSDGSSLDDVLIAAERTPDQDRYIDTGVFSPEAFPNGKGPRFIEHYRRYLGALEAFRLSPDAASLARLRRAVDEGGTTVRVRFAPLQLLPGLKKKAAGPLTVHRSARYPDWDASPAVFRRALVDLFNGNRATSLVREYLDNNLRILTATGVFSVAQNQLRIGSAYAGYYFTAVDPELTVTTAAPPDDADRVTGLAARFGSDALTRTAAAIAAEQDIGPDQIEEFVAARERARFDAVISAAFPPERVLEHLEAISVDYRSAAVQALRDKEFGGKPTVPCMYEYLIGLSLYYAADRAFDPRAAFGLSLDGDFLPISHAPGLRGDIEFALDGRQILVEVTLMDPATQRRGELEPVLRHATNLACEFPDRQVVTLFIANEVDANVARIFGFGRVMELTATDGGHGVASPLIVSLRTADWLAVATAGLSDVLDLVAAESGRTEVAHLNSDWNASLISALRALSSS
ncbi:putative type II restriction enzyme [Gordonia hirsuta DSM 44140 = NBRC 16056]|uniref:Putative type II restriction enzyme n=2 Tax=Gordonia hirsuta TaxID=53427 RepID=L7LFT3_9ACTN|nr:putative type II restriction enzyme [Gordonia hirsuta DSM 44140 = NBRC 16056]